MVRLVDNITWAMYNKLKSEVDLRRDTIVQQMQRDLFQFLKVPYQTNNIPITPEQALHTIFVPCSQKNNQQCENFYIGHGFGGSSLMSFMFIEPLLPKGNVILWETRGMGLSSKLEQYPIEDITQIQAFFLKGIEVLLLFYKHKNCSLIGHSFSSYLLLLFTIRSPALAQGHIKRMLLLSPIGITTKEDDYKNSIRNCSDIFYTLLSKIGWAFNLTYKSPLRTVCSCCKKSLVMDKINEIQMSDPQKQMLYRIIQTFILLPDGSQNLFFRLFQPRVIPLIPLQPLVLTAPSISIVMVYGGTADWVDKTGAKRISERFPERLYFLDVENCGHNIPFDMLLCRQLFERYLS